MDRYRRRWSLRPRRGSTHQIKRHQGWIRRREYPVTIYALSVPVRVPVCLSRRGPWLTLALEADGRLSIKSGLGHETFDSLIGQMRASPRPFGVPSVSRMSQIRDQELLITRKSAWPMPMVVSSRLCSVGVPLLTAGTSSFPAC
jgi:hypothetical protein